MSIWWGSESDDYSYDYEDMELIGDHIFTIAVPVEFDNQFKKNVFAAAKAYTLRNKSIDYTLKAYGETWDFDSLKTNDERIINEALFYVKRTVKQVLEHNMSIHKPDITSLFAAGAALVRLQNTFKATLITIKSKLHFETVSLQRMILEQLAWIYKIHNFQGDFFGVKPSACITNLKQIFSFAGVFYGRLSEGCHMSPETTLRYIKQIDDNLEIHLTDINQTKIDVYNLLVLADMFGIVAEVIYCDLLQDFKFVEMDSSGRYKPLEIRESKKKVKEYQAFLDQTL